MNIVLTIIDIVSILLIVIIFQGGIKMSRRNKVHSLPVTVFSLVSQEDVNKELNKAGISDEQLVNLRKSYFQPMDKDTFQKEGETRGKKRKGNLLMELKKNIVSDLNENDPSVGLYAVTDLQQWAEDNFDSIQGVTLISLSEDQLIFECEGEKFEIYEKVMKVDEDEYESAWDIREYTPSN